MRDAKTTVLLIEDNPGDARLIRELLAEARANRFGAEWADCLAAGLARLAQGDVDVVLLDLGLPDSQGLGTLTQVERQSPQVPIIVLTGLDDEEVAARAVREGAQDYLVKGQVNGDALARVIRYAMERKRAEEALRESEERYRRLVELLPDGLVVHSEGRVVFANPAGARIIGAVSPADLTGKPVMAFVHPDQRELASQRINQALSEGSPVPLAEEEFIRLDGTPIDVEVSAIPFPYAGKPAMLTVFNDITERKQAGAETERLLAQIQAQAQRVQQIVDTVPEGVLLLDAQGRVLMANPVAERDLAVLAQAQVGDVLAHLGNRPLAELLAPPPKGLWHEIRAGARAFAVIARPIGAAPAPESWVLVVDDVTELRDRQRYQQVQERLATVGQLAAGIAHDFNNIMGAIVLYAGMLEKAPELSARHQRYVATIRQQAEYASKLIRQILDFSRRAPMERTALDLLTQTKELVKLLERTLPEHIKLNVRYDRNEYVVHADPTRLQQALMNLAFNARDAMPQGGRLSFTLSALTLAPGQAAPLPDLEPGPWVRLDVADTGTGIAAEHLPHVFEPFFTTKAPGQGTGLGLAQVYGIVKQHEGAIDVTSQVGAGTTFTLYLPLYAEPAAVPAPAAASPPVGAETILLVEDNATTRGAVGEALEGLGYRVMPAATGHEALAELAEPGHGVALVLSDVVMPEMGGVELYRRLRVAHPAVKLLFMTGHALAEGGYEELMRAGVAWLQKPFAVPDLAARVRAVLDAAGAPDL